MLNYDFSNLDKKGRKIEEDKQIESAKSDWMKIKERTPNMSPKDTVDPEEIKEGIRKPRKKNLLQQWDRYVLKMRKNPLWLYRGGASGTPFNLKPFNAQEMYNTSQNEAPKYFTPEEARELYLRIKHAGRARGYKLKNWSRSNMLENYRGETQAKVFMIKAYSAKIKRQGIMDKFVIKDEKFQDNRQNFRIAPSCSNCKFFYTVESSSNYGYCAVNKPKAVFDYKTTGGINTYTSLADLSKFAALHGWVMSHVNTICDNWTLKSYTRNVEHIGKRLEVTFSYEGVAENLRTTPPPLHQNIHDGLLSPKALLKVLFPDRIPVSDADLSKIKETDPKLHNRLIAYRKLYREGAKFLLDKEGGDKIPDSVLTSKRGYIKSYYDSLRNRVKEDKNQ